LDSFRDDRTVDKSIKTTFIHFYIKGQKHPLAGFCCWCFQDGKGYFTVFCSVLKVKGEERLSLSNSDACHSYITIIHIYFISRSFDTGSYRFLSGEKNRVWYVHVVRTRTWYTGCTSRVMSLSAATCQTGCLEDPVFI